MADLSLSRDDLLAEIARFLDFSRDSSQWTEGEQADLESVLRSGLRQFYYPPPLGDRVPHKWTFLRQVGTLATIAGQGDYILPVAVSRIEGDLTFATADSNSYPVRVTGEAEIRQRRQQSRSGRPRLAATRVADTAGANPQRLELLLWPTPDAEHTLGYCHVPQLDALSAASPYPVGGASHAETILASCLAVAERRYEDTRGTHEAEFLKRLAASVAIDQQNAPDFLGYNGDGEIRVNVRRTGTVRYVGRIT